MDTGLKKAYEFGYFV